ncbi:MAG: SOS response-associated peptidase [Deltaproteobacteria bacterium]|nr:SOS response-associated peptidase [Deltaproteobacteria bacterium]
MCGRYALNMAPKSLAEMYEADWEDWKAAPDPPTRYNIAPTQPVLIVRNAHDARRRLAPVMWGLVPSWSKDPSMAARMINARAETAAEKPSFRAAMKYRRCLVPATHFYEWQKRGATKQPWCIRLRDGSPMAFAGLWEHWSSPDGAELESCTILTTSANALMEPLHERMPVILHRRDVDRWLDPAIQKSDGVADLLAPFDAKAMEAFEVSTYVNNARNEGERCVEPPASLV